MLHILFGILKIIGIILLTILGLLLLLLAILLLVPVRYQGSVEKTDALQCMGKVSWMMGMIRLQGSYNREQPELDLFLFGRSLKNRKRKKNRQKRKPEKAQKKQKGKTQTQPEKKTQEMIRPVVPETEKQEESLAEDVFKFHAVENTAQKLPEIQSRSEERKEKEDDLFSGKQKHRDYPLKDMFRKLRKRLQNIRKKMASVEQIEKNLLKKCREVRAVAEKYLDFWHQTATQSAKNHFLREVKYLLRHILPRKTEGTMTIGFEDPATTGQVLGILYMISACSGNCLMLNGDFEKRAFTCEVSIKGHIRICHIIKSALSLLADKNIRQTFRTFRQ